MCTHAGHAVVVDAHIQGQHDALGAVALHPLAHARRIFHSGAPNHDSCRAQCEQGLNVGLGAHSTADLQLQSNLGAERCKLCDEVALRGAPVLGAVQVHHVYPSGTHCAVAYEQGLGRDLVVGLRIEVALVQTHAAARPQIDGGNELKCRFFAHRMDSAVSDKKFAKSRAPAAPERSG